MNVLDEEAMDRYYRVIGVKEYECRDAYVKQALQQLSVLERTCLLLQIDGEFPLSDIADIVGKGEEEVAEVIRKAREEVRQRYESLIEREAEESACSPSRGHCDPASSPQESMSWQQEPARIAPDDLLCDQTEQSLRINEAIHGMPTIKPMPSLPEGLLRFWKERDRANAVPDVVAEGKSLSAISVRPISCDVFISYAQGDRKYVEGLEKHLSFLKWQGWISHWHDWNVSLGSACQPELLNHFSNAAIIVLLLSPDFVTSSRCLDDEIKQALERSKVEEIRVMPVIIRSLESSDCLTVHNHSCPFVSSSILPVNSKPVTKWRDQDEAFMSIVKGIQRTIGELSLLSTDEVHVHRNPVFAEECEKQRTLASEVCSFVASPRFSGQSEEQELAWGEQLGTPPREPSMDKLDESAWKDLYSVLYAFVRGMIFSFHVSSWRGQEYDLAEDIVQESILRVIERSRRIEGTDELSFTSIKHLISNVASNYIKDLRRLDTRLVHGYTGSPKGDQWYERMSEAVTEKVSQEELFTRIALEIAKFPEKQKKAILIDLANRMQFSEKPTALRKAFFRTGIDLQEYQRPLSLDHLERARHLSLVNAAYKRLALFRLEPEVNKPGTYQGRRLVKREKKEKARKQEEVLVEPIPLHPEKLGKSKAM